MDKGMTEQMDLFSLNGEGLCEKPKKRIPLAFSNDIILSSDVQRDDYTEYIQEAFDLEVGNVSEVVVPNRMNLESLGEWNIGVICGASGSGKSTLLRRIAEDNGISLQEPIFDDTKPLISNFSPMQPSDAARLLSHIGLSSVPSWTRPYRVLSNGEQYRARLAKQLADANGDEIILVDEYTSVVDRNVAKAMSSALQKYVRSSGKKVILATCHYDVFDWLNADWIYDLNKGGVLERGDCLRQSRPKIELQVYRTTNDTWEMFKKHHYMTADISSSATCFVFTWNNKVVAFQSILPLPSGGFSNGWREHRLVVLPDFQGLGLGARISEWMGGVLRASGRLFFTKTVNPALGLYRQKHSEKWMPTSHNLKGMSDKEASRMMGGLTRLSYCHRYIGEPIYGYDELLLPTEQIRENERNKGQLTLF